MPERDLRARLEAAQASKALALQERQTLEAHPALLELDRLHDEAREEHHRLEAQLEEQRLQLQAHRERVAKLDRQLRQVNVARASERLLLSVLMIAMVAVGFVAALMLSFAANLSPSPVLTVLSAVVGAVAAYRLARV